MQLLASFDHPPATGTVVGDDRREHFAECSLVHGLSLSEGDGPGCFVVMSCSDDLFRIRDDSAVVQEDVDVVLAASRAQMSPFRTTYGWRFA